MGAEKVARKDAKPQRFKRSIAHTKAIYHSSFTIHHLPFIIYPSPFIIGAEKVARKDAKPQRLKRRKAQAKAIHSSSIRDGRHPLFTSSSTMHQSGPDAVKSPENQALGQCGRRRRSAASPRKPHCPLAWFEDLKQAAGIAGQKTIFISIHSSFIIHHSSFTIHHLPFIIYPSPFIISAEKVARKDAKPQRFKRRKVHAKAIHPSSIRDGRHPGYFGSFFASDIGSIRATVKDQITITLLLKNKRYGQYP